METMVLSSQASTYESLLVDRLPLEGAVHVCADVDTARRYIDSVQVILGQPDMVADVLEEARKLRWVQSTYAGVDALCIPGLRKDYLLTGVKGIFGPLMSEYVMGYIFARERHLFAVRENQRNRVWKPFSSRSFQGLTLGLMGLGSIGEHVAQTARHFGMKTLGFRRSARPCAAVSRVYGPEELSDFLKACDYVVSTLPFTKETYHLLDASVFQAMKPSAVIINAGRGKTLCEVDLVNALEKGEIAGAILDVFEGEPLAKESPLWGMEEVIITPHTAAVSYPETISEIFLRNLKAWLGGGELHYVIDFERGY
ncbi:MAG: D-2-hydroxyacid dehydrogenase [Desulfobacterales bacterium]|nr:D-2-hydroxyacid dehydrogenase [Desulfobacterales bacterium]